ncbi:MAG: hypothetical protein IKC83_02155 [Clostridia bacterium]|nr:hypothetical protein [Clostridia bacterium]
MIEKTLFLNKLLSIYGNILTDKQKDAVELYYNCDMSLGEIALELGITRQGVRDTLTRAETALREAEQKLGFLERTDSIVQRLKNIESRASGELKTELANLINDMED